MSRREARPIVRKRMAILIGVSLLAGGMPASPSIGYELLPLPPQPQNEAWPTSEWARAPLPDDLDREAFETAITRLFASEGRAGYSDTRAVLVVQGGRIVYERYADGFGPESLFQSWSMAKSVTNALTGILVRQGRLALEARAPIPEWAGSDDPRRDLTLEHLLHMRSGLANSDGFGVQDLTRAFISRFLFGEGSRAPAAFAINVPLEHPIGRHWAYSTGTSTVIAKLCGDEIGGGAAGTRDFMRGELFDPIGMSSAQPEFAMSGEFIGGAFVHATARDWARFGYLYLRDGVWDGRRILPEGWVDFSRTPNPAENNRIHGAHFWVNEDPAEGADQWKPLPGAAKTIFLAEGNDFQMVAISPGQDLVAIRLGIAQGASFLEIKKDFGPMVSAFPDRP